MSEGDPYDDDALEAIRPAKGRNRKRADLADVKPTNLNEADSLNRHLACQPLNDDGNAQRLILRCGNDLMYVENIGWFVWDGVRWKLERSMAEPIKIGHKIARAIREEARALEKSPGTLDRETVQQLTEKLLGWSVQAGNMSRVYSMFASAAPHLTVRTDELDMAQMLAAAKNGTIELRTHCEMRESRREDRITRCLGTAFNPKAQCPQFERFLKRIMPDEDMRLFLQRILGYCLTGSIREHKLFLFYGTGRNGKSTLVNVLRKVMGDYAMGAPVATFLAKREGSSGGEPSPDLARLPGARMVTAAEPPEGARLDESKVKEITGGDSITVRHLNQGFFEFQPVFKVILSTNHLPTIRGTDHGIWARINVVPFAVQIPEEEIDRDLEEKLMQEAEGILQWILTGTEDWLTNGLQPPANAVAAVAQYRADEDPVGEFLKAKTHSTADARDPDTGYPFEINAKKLWDCYRAWSEAEGLEPLKITTFGRKLTARGIQKRKSNSQTFYLGICLNTLC